MLRDEKNPARFTDFRMDWSSVCCGIDGSCWTVCGAIDGSCWTVCAGIGGSRGGVLCAINCFGAPLVGARGFLGFRPLLFGIEREPAASLSKILLNTRVPWVDQDHATGTEVRSAGPGSWPRSRSASPRTSTVRSCRAHRDLRALNKRSTVGGEVVTSSSPQNSK
jgi:hypothetical protein